ncbi:hypothetical protein C8Q74DRAFT_325287 [Fomes fomentarius]|nr:hypothetical protein C8Q74DRAFT_325287 [Fomes fomentarius]
MIRQQFDMDTVLPSPTPPATSFKLPGELIDIIMDYLQEEMSALYASALVCRAWLPSSRGHMFKVFKIKRPSTYGRAYYNGRITFLISTPDVACHVRSLHISFHRIDLARLHKVFEELPLLRSLVLSELDITNYGSDYREHEPDPKTMRFHALEELQITSCNIIHQNFPFLFRFLASFDSISRLQLTVTSDDLLLRPPTLDMTSDLIRDSASIALTHLSTFNIPLSVVHKLVAHTHTCNTLRVLWFDQERVEPGHISQIGAIFNVLGPSGCLKRVIFGPLDIFDGERYPYIKDDQQGWAALQLERCRGLEEINLRIRKILRSHVRIFSHLPPSVHAVRITFVGMDARVVAPETRSDWNAFDAAFSEKKFRHIKLVLDMSRVKQTLSADGYARLLDRAIDGLQTVRAQDRLLVTENPRDWWDIRETGMRTG